MAASPISLARRQLAQLRSGLAAQPERLTGKRRAVVACLVRLPPTAIETGRSLDVFFILRASNEKQNRWSGQVGFPGGHTEDGENDHDAVARELQEEVGLSLDEPGAYHFLGCVRERDLFYGGLVVACRVYEQVLLERPRHLQANEVTACGWVPISVLQAMDCARPLKSTCVQGLFGPQWDALPAVQLPMVDVTTANDVAPSDVQLRFVLWGLTLRIVSDWLQATGLRQTPIELRAHEPGESRL